MEYAVCDAVVEKTRESVISNSNISNGASGHRAHSLSDKSFSAKVAAKVRKARSYMEMSLHAASSVKAVGGNFRTVYVLYTGGTIGMLNNKDGVLSPKRGVFENLIRTYPQLHDAALWKQRLNETGFDHSFLVLPEGKDMDLRIFYKIHEYEDLLDSSNMSEVQWIKIAEDLMEQYENYDGFVVLHGTDTLSYTASALSFMFENIGKSVVVTGSQIPIFEPRSDGTDNFVSSLLIAGGLNIPEVTVFFGSKLFRGNRTRKMSANNLFAFDSPNCVPLVEVGIDMEVNKKAIFKPKVIEKCRLHAKMAKNVGLLRIFPSMSCEVVKAFCNPPIEGVVLESYGAGNFPSNRPDVVEAIASAVRRGVIIVNITQCPNGAVSALYETGQLLSRCGVIPGYDMTPEAALTKLSYVLTKTELSYVEKVELMRTNLRGELTDASSITINGDNGLIDALATSLNIQSSKKLIEITEKVFSALVMYSIVHDDERTVKKILDMGADVNAQNSEGHTALHEAITKGNLSIVKYLLENGANVHQKTRCGETPLVTAIHHDNLPIIELLCRCGAHLTSGDSKVVGELLSLAARGGELPRLQALRAAGADFNIPDELQQTALHKAVLCDHCEVLEYLILNGADPSAKDILGYTPLGYASKLQREEAMSLLTSVTT